MPSVAGANSSQISSQYHSHARKLRRDGNKVVTDRYDIVITKDKVRVHDRETNTWFEVSGDPHLFTSDDGHVSDFTNGNLTIDLEDGTKLTIKPTPVENGVSWVDSIAVINGVDAIVVRNIHGTEPIDFGNITADGASVDAEWDDGTVLYTVGEADDLIVAATGDELTSGDQNYSTLDGLGGESRLDYTKAASGPLSTADAVLGRNSIFSGMFKLYETLVDQMRGLQDDLDTVLEASNRLAQEGGDELVTVDPGSELGKLFGGEFDTQEVESMRQKIQLAIQQLTQEIQQTLGTISNISKVYHDTAMNIIRNTRA